MGTTSTRLRVGAFRTSSSLVIIDSENIGIVFERPRHLHSFNANGGRLLWLFISEREQATTRRSVNYIVDNATDWKWRSTAAGTRSGGYCERTLRQSNRQATANTHSAMSLRKIIIDQDIPVAAGAVKPLATAYFGPVPQVHGNNGQGDAELPLPANNAIDISASEFIYQSALTIPNLPTLCSGPTGRSRW